MQLVQVGVRKLGNLRPEVEKEDTGLSSHVMALRFWAAMTLFAKASKTPLHSLHPICALCDAEAADVNFPGL